MNTVLELENYYFVKNILILKRKNIDKKECMHIILLSLSTKTEREHQSIKLCVGTVCKSPCDWV